MQGFQRDVKSDLVSVLEAVSHGFRNVGHVDFDPVDIMLVETFGQRWPRESDDTKRGIVDFWRPRFARYCKPYFMWRLRREVVYAQRGKQADDSMRTFAGYLRQRGML